MQFEVVEVNKDTTAGAACFLVQSEDSPPRPPTPVDVNTALPQFMNSGSSSGLHVRTVSGSKGDIKHIVLLFNYSLINSIICVILSVQWKTFYYTFVSLLFKLNINKSSWSSSDLKITGVFLTSSTSLTHLLIKMLHGGTRMEVRFSTLWRC